MQLNNDLNILVKHSKGEISLVSIYVDDFLLASNTMNTLKTLKKFLSKKYDTKDFREVKTIIR